MNLNSLENKVILITGASSGIGLAAASIAIKNNAQVILISRTITNKKDYFLSLGASEENFLLVDVDVKDANAIQVAVELGIAKFGKIDFLIANAGISMRAMFIETDLSVLHELMDVNFWGAVHIIKAALPYMVKRNEGAITAISSIAGFKGLPARTGYSASKFALSGFIDTLRLELTKTNIQVSLICPGYTSSNIRKSALNAKGKAQAETPLDESKLMTAEKVAIEIFLAMLEGKREVILSREGKLVYLMRFLMPKFLDKLVFQKISKEVNSPFS
jgi:short-subunit dehydrogenase